MTPPNRPRTTHGELVTLVANLIERGLAVDQNFPVLRRLSASQWEVTFEGAEHVAIAMDDIDYGDIHRELTGKRSFSAKLIDGGLLQVIYRFEGEHLLRHRLAFYPSPNLRPFQEDPEAYVRDELFLDIVSRRIVPFPLRFDFDETFAQDVSHPHCHLTLGDVKGCRIPASAPLTPRWFIEFILRNFYQTEEHEFVVGLPGHRFHFAPTITARERGLIHITVPASA